MKESDWILISIDTLESFLRDTKKPYGYLDAWLDMSLKIAAAEKGQTLRKGRDFMIKEAQMLCTRKELALAWGWNKKRVQRFLKRLQEDKWIKLESLSGIGILITDLMYLKYLRWQKSKEKEM